MGKEQQRRGYSAISPSSLRDMRELYVGKVAFF